MPIPCITDLSTVFSTFDIDKWLKIRRHEWKEPLQISEPAKFSIAWDQAPRWGMGGGGGGGGAVEEENKFGVGEKKSTTAWLA